ncbi:MAG: M67 family metallopeptidase [Planctomycetes bacterium]|nr:M67 family metallopeptidase [Planctomycetota bacterium]
MLKLSAAARQAINAHARETYPHECCGVMIGRPATGARIATEAQRCGNLNTQRAHDRFELDPKDYMRLDRQAQKRGLEIVGIYHSHPDHPAKPSQTDLNAAWEGYSYVIVSVQKGEPKDFNSFELKGTAFEQEKIENA